MSISQLVSNGIQVKANQNRILEFSFEMKNWFGPPGYLARMEGRLLYNDYILSDLAVFQSYRLQNESLFFLSQDTASSHFHGSFEIVMSHETIKYIEEVRQQNNLQFTIEVIYCWQQIKSLQEVEKINPQHLHEGNVSVGPVRWHKTNIVYNVARSDWINVLNRLKYSEIELFEVNKLSFWEDENLKQAFEYLRKAESQLRSGNYDGTLADCKLAFESAAKYASAGKVEQGFQIILEKIFPKDSTKSDPFNALIKSISESTHLGRHAQYPHEQISRDEAEFVFISTLNVFSFLSRRLKKS